MSYLILFLCGVLTALPLIWGPLFPLPWFSLIPLFLVAIRKKSAYRHGLVFSAGYYLVLYHWFLYLYPMDFAGFSRGTGLFIVLLGWFGMTLLQGVGTAFVPFLFRRLYSEKRALWSPFAAAALWCVMEWLQTRFWFGVPWGRLALTQTAFLPMIQSVSLFGSLGLGFLMVLANALWALAIEKHRTSGSFRQPAALAAILLLLLNGISGTFVMLNPAKADGTVTAAAIQGNIASGDKWADDSVSHALSLYSGLTRKAVAESGASLVVWPETVITVSLAGSPSVRASLCDLARETGVYLAVGAFDGEERDGETVSYNAIYLFHPDGTVNETVYHKRHLVPFGEYLPMEKLIRTVLPSLAEMNLFDSQITPGTDPALFETPLGTIGSLVCFDSIYETLTLSSVRAGAELMLLSTNDSWYRDSAAVYQHNAHAILRAVETGRSFVRAANTGVSSLIAPTGQTVSSLGPLVTGYVTGDVTIQSHRTLYARIGNAIVILSALLLTAVFSLRVLDIRKDWRQNAHGDPGRKKPARKSGRKPKTAG